jgi:putative protease
MKNNKYELMAPAGNFPMLVAAVKAGADAVYFGLQEFTMRAKIKNFKFSDLDKMREICNSSPRKPKLYLTLNTIIYEEELKNLEKLIKKVKGKVDAVICWDHSVMSLCRKYKVPFFISTQASISNTIEAEFYKKLGAERVVLARELNLKQIKAITKIIEVETFIHGAMCVAVSGRCFMSQFTHNSSANRGACLQNCRRSYVVTDDSGKELKVENSKIMSAKDMCTLPLIEDMKKAGIISYKIEGRGRDPRYVDYVVRSYRKALDNKLTREEIIAEMNELKKVFNRDFSSGFFMGKPTPNDFSKVEHSSATEKKEFIGNVIHYFSKVEVATIKLSATIKIGDKIAVIGKTTGIEEFLIRSMEIENKQVKVAKKGGEVGIKIPRIRKNDEVYRIIPSKK